MPEPGPTPGLPAHIRAAAEAARAQALAEGGGAWSRGAGAPLAIGGAGGRAPQEERPQEAPSAPQAPSEGGGPPSPQNRPAPPSEGSSDGQATAARGTASRPYTPREWRDEQLGTRIELPTWWDGVSQREALRWQTEMLAGALERRGIVTRLGHDDLTLLGAVSGAEDHGESWRHIRILPEVARRDRAPLLRELQKYLSERDPRGYARLMTLTVGRRVPLRELRERCRQVLRRCSRWADDVARPLSIEPVYCAVEYTIDADGLAHAHAHAIVIPRKKLGGEAWGRFLAATREAIGGKIDDAGRLREPREAVKYVCKPADLLLLTEEQLEEVYWQTYRLRFASPMGEFREFRRRLRERGLRVARHREGLVYVRGDSRPREEPDPNEEAPPKIENRVLFMSNPAPRFAPIAEPVIHVLGYTTRPTTQAGARGLQMVRDLQRAAAARWIERGLEPIAVAQASAIAYEREMARRAAERAHRAAVAARARRAPSTVHTRTPSAERPPPCRAQPAAAPG